MIGARPLTLFVYGIAVTVLAFASRSTEGLAVLALFNAPVGVALGTRKYPTLLALFLVGLAGLLLNALVFANTGRPVVEIYGVSIREGALVAFANVTLRMLSILGASLVFLSQTNARDLVRSLESELGLPKGLAFATAVSLRMLSMVERDAREVQLVRAERGYRKYPVTPSDVESFLRPLLSLGLERATWIGVAAELRGFSQRASRRARVEVGPADAVAYALLAVQVVLALR